MCALHLQNLRRRDQLALCKKYFYIGCALLPFVWLVNFIWFFKVAYKDETFHQQREIRKYVTLSLIGSLVWGVLLLIWNGYFHYFRREYAQYFDYLSFTFPVGYV
uniref:Gamma-secretase subunit PEN-2 n=1 Tax=Panagrolaimus sp. JU765 TaxID=591449 RepID=A0AC34RJT4_9BILA